VQKHMRFTHDCPPTPINEGFCFFRAKFKGEVYPIVTRIRPRNPAPRAMQKSATQPIVPGLTPKYGIRTQFPDLWAADVSSASLAQPCGTRTYRTHEKHTPNIPKRTHSHVTLSYVGQIPSADLPWMNAIRIGIRAPGRPNSSRDRHSPIPHPLSRIGTTSFAITRLGLHHQNYTHRTQFADTLWAPDTYAEMRRYLN